MYKLHISCVDGDTHYTVGSSDRILLRNFLDMHDHEGSTVSLEVWDLPQDTRPVKTMENPEEVYAFLMLADKE